MTFKSNRKPLLCHFKLCASFQSHLWVQTWVIIESIKTTSMEDVSFSQETPNSGHCSTWVTLKFDRWHRKTIGNLFNATWSFVHNFVAICGYKLELLSRNVQIEAKLVLISATLTFELWSWLFARASFLSMVITPEHYMDTMTGTWWKGDTGGQTGRWTDRRTMTFVEVISCS